VQINAAQFMFWLLEDPQKFKRLLLFVSIGSQHERTQSSSPFGTTTAERARVRVQKPSCESGKVETHARRRGQIVFDLHLFQNWKNRALAA